MFKALDDRGDIYKAMEIPFSDGEYYCEQWLPLYIVDNLMIMVIPLVIIIVNFISKTILRKMTKYEKR